MSARCTICHGDFFPRNSRQLACSPQCKTQLDFKRRKTWWGRNKDKAKKYRRDFYAKNREKLLADAREYHWKNRERILAYDREYWRKNRDKMRSASKKKWGEYRKQMAVLKELVGEENINAILASI